MDLLMNGLLFAATLFAGGYCWVLSRRVQDLKSLDKGLGGSIVTLTRQIELARLTLDEAKAATRDRRQDLSQLVSRAEAAAGQLRMLIAVVPPMPEPEPQLRATRDVAPPTPEPQPAAAPVLRAVPHPLPAPERTPERTPEPTPEPAARPEAQADTPPARAEVPKPRALAPVENPLRRARSATGAAAPSPSSAPSPAVPAPAPAALTDEADLLEALSALAGTGAR